MKFASVNSWTYFVEVEIYYKHIIEYFHGISLLELSNIDNNNIVSYQKRFSETGYQSLG